MILSEEAYEKIKQATEKFPPERKRSAAVAAMTIAQDEQGWLSPELMEELAAFLGMPAAAVQELAGFYSMFNLKPVGKYKITVCSNVTCELTGSDLLNKYLKDKLGIEYGDTTPDGLFTLVEGECMGVCAEGPVMLVNNKKMHTRMTHEKVDQLLEDLKNDVFA